MECVYEYTGSPVHLVQGMPHSPCALVALQSLVDRNDALRTIYTPNGQGGWIPQALRAGAAKITLNVIDVADSKVRLAHELRRYR